MFICTCINNAMKKQCMYLMKKQLTLRFKKIIENEMLLNIFLSNDKSCIHYCDFKGITHGGSISILN